MRMLRFCVGFCLVLERDLLFLRQLVIVLFFKKYFESDADAFKGCSNNFAVCHDGAAGIGKIKFQSDFLPGKKPVPGVNKNAAGTDIVNGCLETAFHGPAVRNHQLGAFDFFAGIFSSL
jgi:hypothetical protein